MSSYRVSYPFSRLPDAPLGAFGQMVVTKLTNNPGYVTPLVPLATITAAVEEFNQRLSAMVNGGKQATMAKDQARQALVGLLRLEANNVQTIAGEDPVLLLSSGFDIVNSNRAQVQLEQPVVEQLDNPMSRQIGMRLIPVYTAKAYEVRVKVGTNDWQGAGVFTQSRLIIDNLLPGTTYILQARAVGGSTGYSDWSDPVSHMAM